MVAEERGWYSLKASRSRRGVSGRQLGLVAFACGTLLLSDAPAAQFVRQARLYGSGAAGSFDIDQGHAVAVSGDGNTVIVGDPGDNGGMGAAWIWTRQFGAWSQQGPKLVAKNVAGVAGQGYSVALSADGNAAIVGGNLDDNYVGAAWIWTRDGDVWTQRGPKLVGAGAVGHAQQGASVSLSASGDTAIVGGDLDGGGVGAAWIWTRRGDAWTQQGPKLVGAGAVGTACQGHSVALSSDGNTAIVGGNRDNGLAGAVWVWTRSGGIWTQQGSKLVASDAAGKAGTGDSVSLSADGNTAIIGGRFDNDFAGAAWVWIRSAGVWTQQGSKRVAAGAVGSARQGASVSLSGDGNTALVGGDFDNNKVGAAWVWTRTGNAWTQQGPKVVGSNSVAGSAVSLSADGQTAVIGGGGIIRNTFVGTAWVYLLTVQPALLADFDGDRKADFALWRPSTGKWSWLTSLTGYDSAASAEVPGPSAGANDVALAGDLDGDGKADLVVWHRETGTWSWQTSSTGYSVSEKQVAQSGPGGLGDVPMLADLDGDGKADLVVWHAGTGTWSWLTSSTGYAPAGAGSKRWGDQSLGDMPLLADMDGDGKADLVLWRASTGTWYWLTSSTGYSDVSESGKPRAGVQWGSVNLGDIPMAADLDGDRKAELIVWRASTGIWFWLTSSTSYDVASSRQAQLGDAAFGDVPILGDLDGDGKADLVVWRASADTWLWLTSSTGYAATGQGRLQRKAGTPRH